MMLFSKHLMVIGTGGAVGKPLFRVGVIASAVLAFSSAAGAAGLGRLNVLSDLGQPLRAEIDVVAVEKGEADSLNAKLATIESYLQNNLPYPSPQLGLKLSLEKRPSGAPYIVATTAQAVNEPFVDILVELTWNNGRILRAYTALLDPPAYANDEQAATAAAAAATKAPEVRPAPAAAPPVEAKLGSEFAPKPAEPPAEPAPAAEAAATAAPAPAEPDVKAAPPQEAGMPKGEPEKARPGEEYAVRRGDTLTKIAKQYKTGDVSLEQMLVVLFRNNPDAFAGKNMNRLKTGRVLQVPASSEAAAVSVKDARREVQVQAADFNAYREQLAGAVAGGAGTESAGQSAGGAVSPKLAEQAPAAQGQPKEVLKLSKGGGAGDATSAQERVRSLEEELSAREKTIKEQSERVAKLEKTVKDLQAVLELKNKGMADLQKGTAPAPAAPAKPGMPAMPEKPAAAATPPAAAPAPAATPAPTPASTPTAAATPAEAGAASAPAAAATAASTTAKKPKPRVMAPPPQPEPGLLDTVMDNPLYLAGGAAVVALLGFLGFRTLKKRKEGAVDDLAEAEKKNSDLAAQSPPAATDTSAGMAAAERPAAPAPVTEEVDPLAEADIYLAYGRDGQAEEILKEALQSSPRRHEIHLKLLEIYAKRRDLAAFDPIARELQMATGGQGELWAQAAALGYQIDPQNPRYAAGRPAGAAAAAAVAGAGLAAAAASSLEERLDFNIGLDDQDTGTKTDIDLTRLGAAGGGTTTDIDLSNLGGTGAGPEIDLSTLSGVPERTVQVPDIDLDLGAGDGKPAGLDFDFDLNALTAAQGGQTMADSSATVTRAMSQTVADVGEPGLGTVEFDLSKISLDSGSFGKQEPTLDADGEDGAVPDIDLSGISLDLGGEPAAGGAATTAAAKDDHWYDVQTKFDLAKAYQEMGDKEGAREILREVISEGDQEQQEAAQRVLEAIA